MLCQFCYWSTKEIDITEEKADELVHTLNKLSANIKDS